MALPPITFAMPLRSSVTTDNWPRVVRVFRSTLVSVLGQTDPNIRVVVCCHEVPDVQEIADPRVTVIRADFPPPADLHAQFVDKSRKLAIIAETFARAGGGYLVLMDADDLVSNRLAAFIRSDDNRSGYLIRTGYVLNFARRWFWKTRKFNIHSGSSAVFYVTPEGSETDGAVLAVIRSGKHKTYAARSAAAGRPLTELPFPAAIYVRHHGENLSQRKRERKRLTDLRNTIGNVLSRLVPFGRVPERVRREFGLGRDFFP